MSTKTAVTDLPYRSDTKVPVPEAVRRFANGTIPGQFLFSCGIRSFEMVEPAATSMCAMVAAASGDGVKLSATGTWRSYEEQKQLFLSRYVTDPTDEESKTWNGTTYWKLPDVPSAATPGRSNHGLGLAVDFSDSPTVPIGSGRLAWLKDHGPSFGFWNTVRSEAWHWTYCLGDDVPAGVEAPVAGRQHDHHHHDETGGTGGAEATGMRFQGEVTIGTVGDAVRAVQSRLVEFGHHVVVDGEFGEQTLAAVEQFQRDRGLADDGRVGPKTWAALGLPPA